MARYSPGIQVVAAMVVLGLVGAVLVVLARAGFWQTALLPDRCDSAPRLGAGGVLPGPWCWSASPRGAAGMEVEWWLYGPSGLVIGLLALVVAGSGGARPRFHRPHRTLPLH